MKDLRIYDRDMRPVSQGAFNAMQDSYDRMGTRVKQLQGELNDALDVIEVAKSTNLLPPRLADVIKAWERRETRSRK